MCVYRSILYLISVCFCVGPVAFRVQWSFWHARDCGSKAACVSAQFDAACTGIGFNLWSITTVTCLCLAEKQIAVPALSDGFLSHLVYAAF